eukprot:gene4886-6900_t
MGKPQATFLFQCIVQHQYSGVSSQPQFGKHGIAPNYTCADSSFHGYYLRNMAREKGVITNIFMIGSLKLHPFDLLQMYALIFIRLTLTSSVNSGSASHYFDICKHAPIHVYLNIYNGDRITQFLLSFAESVTAFLLNIVSFNANRKTSPLAMNIGGITKQVLAIVVGIVLFQSTVTVLSACGVVVTVIGIIWYAMASFRQKQAEQAHSEVLQDLEKSNEADA